MPHQLWHLPKSWAGDADSFTMGSFPVEYKYRNPYCDKAFVTCATYEKELMHI